MAEYLSPGRVIGRPVNSNMVDGGFLMNRLVYLLVLAALVAALVVVFLSGDPDRPTPKEVGIAIGSGAPLGPRLKRADSSGQRSVNASPRREVVSDGAL